MAHVNDLRHGYRRSDVFSAYPVCVLDCHARMEEARSAMAISCKNSSDPYSAALLAFLHAGRATQLEFPLSGIRRAPRYVSADDFASRLPVGEKVKEQTPVFVWLCHTIFFA